MTNLVKKALTLKEGKVATFILRTQCTSSLSQQKGLFFPKIHRVFGQGGGATFTFSTDGGMPGFGFGGGPGMRMEMPGQGRGGGRQQQYRQSAPPPQQPFKDSKFVSNLDDTRFTENTLQQSDDVWLIDFYSTSNCTCKVFKLLTQKGKSCKDFESVFEKVGENLDSYVKLGAIDCSQFKSSCENVHGNILFVLLYQFLLDYPHVRLYNSPGTASKYVEYSGEITSKAIVEWSIQNLPHNVASSNDVIYFPDYYSFGTFCI